MVSSRKNVLLGSQRTSIMVADDSDNVRGGDSRGDVMQEVIRG